MRKVVNMRLKVTEERNGAVALPRIVRLCRRFDFTPNETSIAVCTLVSQSDYESDGGYGVDVLTMCQFLEIPLQEMLDFLGQERLHMAQGFFPEIQPGYIFSCSLAYDVDFCKALMGSQLKDNEFLKLEQTYLADVIAEEPGNEHYRDENLGLGLKSSEPIALGASSGEIPTIRMAWRWWGWGVKERGGGGDGWGGGGWSPDGRCCPRDGGGESAEWMWLHSFWSPCQLWGDHTSLTSMTKHYVTFFQAPDTTAETEPEEKGKSGIYIVRAS